MDPQMFGLFDYPTTINRIKFGRPARTPELNTAVLEASLSPQLTPTNYGFAVIQPFGVARLGPCASLYISVVFS